MKFTKILACANNIAERAARLVISPNFFDVIRGFDILPCAVVKDLETVRKVQEKTSEICAVYAELDSLRLQQNVETLDQRSLRRNALRIEQCYEKLKTFTPEFTEIPPEVRGNLEKIIKIFDE